jgi:hypothetical protein
VTTPFDTMLAWYLSGVGELGWFVCPFGHLSMVELPAPGAYWKRKTQWIRGLRHTIWWSGWKCPRDKSHGTGRWSGGVAAGYPRDVHPVDPHRDAEWLDAIAAVARLGGKVEYLTEPEARKMWRRETLRDWRAALALVALKHPDSTHNRRPRR